MSGHRLPRPDGHLRAVPHQRGRAKPHPPARADARHPPVGARGRDGHAATRRLGQGVRRRDHDRRSAPGHSGRRVIAMPVFVYRAADRRGQTIDGVMEAPDARAVVERLQRDAYFPIRVALHAERGRWLSLGGSSRVRRQDLLAFTQQLATLFEAGLPPPRALSVPQGPAPHQRAKSTAADLLLGVRGGSSLSEALTKHHPRPFSRLYINMIRAGERGGVLELTLRRLAEFLEARAAFAEAVLTAVAYPAPVFTLCLRALIFLISFLIPPFSTIFSDLGQTMPLPTQILLWMSAGVQGYWWAGVLLILGALLTWRVWTGSPQGRVRWDQSLLGLP